MGSGRREEDTNDRVSMETITLSSHHFTDDDDDDDKERMSHIHTQMEFLQSSYYYVVCVV